MRQILVENYAMKFFRSMIIAGCFPLIAGCTGKDFREGLCQGVYEGDRIEKQKELTPRERAAMPEMDYQQYTIEKKGRGDESR
jgi:hypothetical protein